MRLRFPRLLSLRFQILLSLSILLITAVVLLGLVLINFSRNVFVEEKRRSGVMIAEMLQRTLTSERMPSELPGEMATRALAARVASRVHDDRYMHSISFFDISGQVVWSTLSERRWQEAEIFSKSFPQPVASLTTSVINHPINDNRMILVQFPWKYMGALFGRVQVILPIVQPEHELFFSGWLILALAGAYAGILILFGALLLNRMVATPVKRLNDALRKMSAGNRSVRLPISETTELAELANSFNEMASSLSESEQQVAEQINELLDINEELELTRRGLMRSERLASVGQLAAGVAHEVGNPLSAILGYVGLMQDGGVDEENVKDILTRIEKDVIRIRSIVKGLLDYSRPGSSEVKRLDLNLLVDETIELVRMQNQFKYIEMNFNSHKRPAPVEGDESELQQVLVNLFLNAAQAMNGEGSITIFLEEVIYDPSLTFRESSENFAKGQPLISLAVIDNGPGIDEERQANIFTPFYTTKDPGYGTGLGLAICERTTDSHGGEIGVQSKKGEGATFVILLPESTNEAEQNGNRI